MNTSRPKSHLFQPSGKFTAPGLLAFFTTLVAVALLLSYPYGWLTYWSSYFFEKLIIWIFLVFFLLTGIGLAVDLGKIRNEKVAFAGGFLAALGTLYASWLFWISLHPDTRGIWLGPGQVFSRVSEISQTWKIWTLRDSSLGGNYLYLAWGIEALSILMPAAWGGKYFARRPYCESCDQWMEGEKKLRYFEPVLDFSAQEERKEVREKLKRGDWKILEGLSQKGEDEVEEGGSFTRVKVKKCPECENYYALELALYHCDSEASSDGKVRLSLLAKNLEMDRENFLQFFGKEDEGKKEIIET